MPCIMTFLIKETISVQRGIYTLGRRHVQTGVGQKQMGVVCVYGSDRHTSEREAGAHLFAP